MENVKIADTKVAKMRHSIANAKKVVGTPVDEMIGYLHCLERLAALERHLYNLTSNGYINE